MATETIKEIELYDGDTKVYPKTDLSAIYVSQENKTLDAYIKALIAKAVDNVKTELGITGTEGTVTFGSKPVTFSNVVTATNADNNITGTRWE